MASRYTREDVETHSTGGIGGPYLPAVNVKYYGRSHADAVAERFKCSKEVAQRACNWAWEMACESFWDCVQDTAEWALGAGVKVWQAGRSGGWAVVEGLPELESWDAVQLAKWRRFEKACKADVEYRTSQEAVLEDIEANRWAEENAEAYNFIDKKDGETVCLADVPRCTHCA